MAGKLPAPKGLRNGLRWREGRPRWEPSPASRGVGVKGRDLRSADGTWMHRGEAIGAADARALWATLLREANAAGKAGEEARLDLRLALEALSAPKDAGERHARALVIDLVDTARVLLDGIDAGAGVRLVGGPRTVDAMIDGYFADRSVKIAAGTRDVYQTMARRIRPRLGHRRVDEVTRGELRVWYIDLVEERSIFTANLTMGALGAFYKWAGWQDWIEHSPVSKLGMQRAPGRRVYWTMEEERDFVVFCDANGFEEVADGVTACLWTAARISDMCNATLQDLAGDTWRYVPQKTQRKGQEALPALLPAVKARIERRRASTLGTLSRAFLIAPNGRAHDTRSFWQRYTAAKSLALAAEAVPASFAGKRVQDTRDTCVTRLADAGVPFMKIWPWTGHSSSDAEDILRTHYIVLREEGAMETARVLEDWAERNRVTLNA